MEIWFLAAVGGAVFAGLSNFFFKLAASRGYNSEVFTLYGGLTSITAVSVVALLSRHSLLQFNWLVLVMLLAGAMASMGGIMKVYALRHIDSTIYFPLFKMLSPALAIVFGIVFFAESFSYLEWLGLILGLLVPLLLINKVENLRQNNLRAGLMFILLTAVISASASALNKLVIDSGISVLVGLFYASVGVFVGTLITISFKQGPRSLIRHIKEETDMGHVFYGAMRSLLISVSLGLVLFAYTTGAALAIAQTIHSMYILIPIVLSIIIYNEHWNLQKATAIIISILSLWLLG